MICPSSSRTSSCAVKRRAGRRSNSPPRLWRACAASRGRATIRELQNLVERLSILHPGKTIDREHLPLAIGERRKPAAPAATVLPSTGLDLREHLGNIEKQLISSALAQTDGTVAHAARLLNLRRTTLVEKLRKYDLLAHA